MISVASSNFAKLDSKLKLLQSHKRNPLQKITGRMVKGVVDKILEALA